MVSNVSLMRIVSLFSSEANARVPDLLRRFTRSWLSQWRHKEHESVMIEPSRRAVTCLVLAFGTAGAWRNAAAAPAASSPPGTSDWSPGMHSALRIVDGGPLDGDVGRRLAALIIRLDPHFKTYWRTPGDSGLPPVFDWSASRNVRAVEVLWPAPMRFEDTAGSSIGYQDKVVFPLHVTLGDPGRPAQLVLRLDYAVCEKICIPAQGSAQVALPAGSAPTPHAGLVRDALRKVPARAVVGEGPAPTLRTVVAGPDGSSLVAAALVPDSASIVDIFTEGPADWTFAAPMAMAVEPAGPGTRLIHYRIGVDARPPGGGVLAGLPLNLTLTAGETALEFQTRLDGEAKSP